MCVVQGERTVGEMLASDWIKCDWGTEGLIALHDRVLSWRQMTVDAGFCGPSILGSRVVINPLAAQSV